MDWDQPGPQRLRSPGSALANFPSLLSSYQGLPLVDHIPSVRASILTRRTYCRPLDDEGTRFETWPQVVDRVLGHQRWLWERAQGGRLRPAQEEELVALGHLIRQRKCLPAGRVLWLGGTEIVKRRPASNFNCAFNEIQSVHDIVDIFWLLLQGCGTGFKPVNGVLSGFSRKIEISTIPSERTERGGTEANVETYDSESGVWTIRVGDSAEAWAKAAGKLVVGRYPAKRLVLDFSEIRPAGSRLRGYGWICSGDTQLARAFTAIATIRNRRVGKLLTKIDLLDIVNWLGTVLSTRRSAQACLMDHGDPEWEAFANAKPPGYWEKNPQRAQSNNGLCFWEKPSTREIRRIFEMMIAHGGAEPSFNNAAAARKRAPWFAGFNPCVSGDTWILTDLGPRQARDLCGDPFRAIVSGNAYESTDCGFFPTGEKMVYRVETDRGSFECTDNHQIMEIYHLTQKSRLTRWTQLKQLKAGDRISLQDQRQATWEGDGTFDQGWLVGSLLGDGVFTRNGASQIARLSFWGESKTEMRSKARAMLKTAVHGGVNCGLSHGPITTCEIRYDRVNINSTPLHALALEYGLTVKKTIGPALERTSPNFHAGFLRGYFDADGTVVGTQEKGISVRLVSVNLENLKVVQRMLARLGIISTIYQNRRIAGDYELPDGHGGMKLFACQTSHELVIARENVRTYRDRVGFHEPAKAKRLDSLLSNYKRALNRERFVAKIKAIVPVGVQTVYDCTIPSVRQFDGNGFNLHNCYEILCANRGFCNLVDINLDRFHDDNRCLHEATWIMARANYRQTLVDLRDGVLQSAWHENNEFLRLCGVGTTAIVQRPDLDYYAFRQLDATAIAGAYSMADELGTERPKNVTTVKPSGTSAKICDCTEGAHKPLGRYIFNNVAFGRHDPLVPTLFDANYRIVDHPTDPSAVLITLPVEWKGVPFETVRGVPINQESAIAQLERYRMLMDAWCDQNVSVTVSYDPGEVPAMVKWFERNWDSYVGVSFLFRNDPTKTAADLGFAYLPQNVVSESEFQKYVDSLKQVDLEAIEDDQVREIDAGIECPGGACPVK
jgi:ribonucleotide reductase, class II